MNTANLGTAQELRLERRLRQDRQRLLQTRDLLLAARLAFAIRHDLRRTLRFELVQISEDRIELTAGRRLVVLPVAKGDLQLLHLSSFSLCVLLLRGGQDLHVLGEFVVHTLLLVLSGLSFSEEPREIGLRYFEDRDNRRRYIALRAPEIRRAGAALHERRVARRSAVVLRENFD